MILILSLLSGTHYQAGNKTANAFNFNLEFFAPKTRERGAEEAYSHYRFYCQEFDAIIISPIDTPQIRQVLKEAVSKGIKIIFINSALDDVPYETLMKPTIMSLRNAAKRQSRF